MRDIRLSAGQGASVLLVMASLSANISSRGEDAARLPRSLAYVLQAERLAGTRHKAVARLASCGRDWIIMDVSFAGDEQSRWRRSEIINIRGGKPGRKVFAYLSIGEAEDYRSYWQQRWKRERPTFLLQENPRWRGNYMVKYWSPAWQCLILKEADKISAQGFDGLYLDKVDAFEDFEYDPKRHDWIDGRRNPESGRSYRTDMIEWVKKLVTHVRRRKKNMLIAPQNGCQLLRDPEYRRLVDAVGVEDLFTDGRTPAKPSEVASRVQAIELLAREGKPVLCVDYSKKRTLRRHATQLAHRHGYVLLITDRDLTTLGHSADE